MLWHVVIIMRFDVKIEMIKNQLFYPWHLRKRITFSNHENDMLQVMSIDHLISIYTAEKLID